MIPNAIELKEEIQLRRSIEAAADSASNPAVAEAQALVLLERIKYELEKARQNQRTTQTSIDISINVREKHNESLSQLRQFLIARGYSLTINADTITLSWS